MIAPRRRRFWWLVAALVALILLSGGLALARVGGGESFGGGGGDSGGGGGGGGGGGELIGWVIWLAVRYPEVGVPVLVLVVIGAVWVRKMKQGTQLRSTRSTFDDLRTSELSVRRAQVKGQINSLTAEDPNFSETLFLDFVHMIYTRFQLVRGTEQLEALRPYLSPELFSRLEDIARQMPAGSFRVTDVIVGALAVEGLLDLHDRWTVVVGVEANYTEHFQGGEAAPSTETYYSRGRLTFRRERGVISKGPEQIRSLGCPSCGSPMKLDDQGVCAYCGQAVRPGLFHWELNKIEELQRTPRVQVPLEVGEAEVGTDFPTLFDHDLDVQTKAFLMRCPGESLQRLVDRAKEIFLALQEAWTTGHWEKARAFETDRLFQVHLFWIARYQENKIRNILEQVQIVGTEVVKMDRDAFFESATLRIKASMIDYKVNAEGKVIGGSKKVPRVFSEYWTFIRKAGFKPGQQADTTSCPSCGAPVKVAMDGRCDYCGANLASGDFDWTLSKIDQDEVYVG